ncbi:hypothetical protein LQW54_001532 [Pestalotiopsis sp. IQ-011]
MTAETILIAGANGYLALHIIHQALGKGWNVVGSIRSDTAAANIKELFPDAGTRLSLFHISDLTGVESFEEAFRHHAITAVINAASPILNNPQNQKTDVVDPAINGGLAILRAANIHGGTALKRVVHIGSVSSTIDLALGDAPGHTWSPDTWNPIGYDEAVGGDYTAGYVGSKALTERAMWDFMKVERRFDFVSVLPAIIFGPHVAAPIDIHSLSVSSKLLWELAAHNTGNPSPWHAVHMGVWVDVRDAVEAALRAVEVPGAGGHRFLVGQKTHWQFIRDAARYSDELRGHVDPGTPGAGEAASTTTYDVDGSKAETVLGLTYTALSTSVKDSLEQLLAIDKKDIAKDG